MTIENATTSTREQLSPEVLQSARDSLVIERVDAEQVLNTFDPEFLLILNDALYQAKSNLEIRAALNRVLYTARNLTFSFACKEAAEEAKVAA